LAGGGGGSTPKISPSPAWSGTPHLTHCVTGPRRCTYQVACNSIELFNLGAQLRQMTDHTTDKGAPIGRIAWAAKSDSA